MEAFVGLIILISVIAFLIFFKGMIKKTSNYCENVVTTNVTEASIDLIKRSKVAYDRIISEVGEDYESPQEVYNKIMRNKKESVQPKTKK